MIAAGVGRTQCWPVALLVLCLMFVLEQRDGDFVVIADDAQGTIYLAPPVNGYIEIVSQGRAGGGEYTRILRRYENGRYRVVRIADYREPGPDEPLQFIRERSPEGGSQR